MDDVPIEDFHEDIVGKAARGLGVGKGELAEKGGISRERVEALLAGEGDETALRLVAPVLGLDAEKLVVSARKAWRPEPRSVPGLFQTNTPFGDMFVNSFLVWDPLSGKAAVFDTGTDAEPLLTEIRTRDLKVEAIFLTHQHGDHVADLPKLLSATGAPAYANRLEPNSSAASIDEGYETQVGGLSIRALLTSGHSPGGTTYLVDGLSAPLAVVGDALFAGSMGGGMVSYPDALRNNREKLMTLPDETIVCPGHGPITTIAEEKKVNPFFPEFPEPND